MADRMIMALAGQPNAGKSTIFNMLTGARQHVANYPGVTVEKKVGQMSLDGLAVELVDLPGTYSLTSYSLEERVARDYLLMEQPQVVINVADASNLKRHLFLTFQLMEMGKPVVVALNMMDMAESRNQRIDADKLSSKLGVAVVPTVGRTNKGGGELRNALEQAAKNHGKTSLALDYGPLEQPVFLLEKALADVPLKAPARWMAIKLLEGDKGARDTVDALGREYAHVQALARELREEFTQATGEDPDRFIEKRRYETADAIVAECVHAPDEGGQTFSDRVDRFICHRVWGYFVLFGLLYLMYTLPIELGYKLTNYTWPVLAWARETIASILPGEEFVADPLFRSMILWLVDSVNALLNYIPIFLILFIYIALLEDIGYMPRMAFLLDAFFRRYGLHGQSTLPLVLGGVYVGGCAVPGVMACRAVPDERARLATILVVPMMNCLAKMPLYVLLIGIYFAASKGPAMFFISTITILMALTTSKLLNLSVLRDKETAPFIMEMPPYHRPGVRTVVGRGVERVWLYIKKIITVVAAVAVVLFGLMQFPGVPAERMADLERQADQAKAAFTAVAAKAGLGRAVDSPDKINRLFAFFDSYKSARMSASTPAESKALNERFRTKNPDFFAIVKPGGNKRAKKANRAFKKLRRERLRLRNDYKNEVIQRSFLGRLGHWMEPVTKYAGFTWRVNVALLSALAAKENTVATLGALYQSKADVESLDQGSKGEASLEKRMAAEETGFTPLHALALMLFMALYPPCMATTMVVKMQAGSWKWMGFSLVYMMILGSIVAGLVFSGGSALGITGLQAMAAFYGLALAAVIVTGLIRPRPTDE